MVCAVFCAPSDIMVLSAPSVRWLSTTGPCHEVAVSPLVGFSSEHKYIHSTCIKLSLIELKIV